MLTNLTNHLDSATVLLAVSVCLALSALIGAFFSTKKVMKKRAEQHQKDAIDRAKKKIFTYCPVCSHKLELKYFSGKQKQTCSYCKWTHWNGPTLVSVPVVFSACRKLVLLVKRLIPPAIGKFCCPGGYVETGEGLQAGASREGVEETGLILKILGFLMEFPVPEKNEILVFWLAEEVGGKLVDSEESADVGYKPVDNLPEMAFPSHEQAIKLGKEKVDKLAG